MIPAYFIHQPRSAQRVPLVLDSPHSSARLPDDFGHVVAAKELRDAEDMYVDDLYASAPDHGATFLTANFHRTYIDPNRHEADIDLELIDGEWPFEYLPSGKADIGKSLVWRTLEDGRPIYANRLSAATVRHRIDQYLRPYQHGLKGLLDDAWSGAGVVWHINCHSMRAVGGRMAEGGAGKVRADIVLGDRDGTSCSMEFTALVSEYFHDRGYGVAINEPYKGVELVRAFSDPSHNRHSLQIELNKRLYMDERSFERNGNYARLRSDLDGLVAMLASELRGRLNSLQ
jgi:N-formylglutamate deformylase